MIEAIRQRVEQREAALRAARAFAEAVAQSYAPLCAVLFGSFARGDFHDGSDLDVLLISEAFPGSTRERERVLYDLSPGGIDIFAYRPGEFRRLLGSNHPTAWFGVREGVVLLDDGTWAGWRAEGGCATLAPASAS